jgi:hypothetical protein
VQSAKRGAGRPAPAPSSASGAPQNKARRNARHVACLRCTQISGMPVEETVRPGPNDKSGARLLCSAPLCAS